MLLVAGSAATVVVTQKENAAFWQPKKTAMTNLNKISDALIAYQRTYHRLPCVAPVHTLSGQAAHGVEIANCDGGAAATVGTQRFGLGGGVYLRVGALPHLTLALGADGGEDAYGNRYTYAVIESLTNTFKFTDGSGAIIIQDDAGSPIMGNAAWVVVSHGADMKGAFGAKSTSGAMVVPCTAAGKDLANCITSLTRDNIYRKADLEPTEGVDHFDDIIAYNSVDVGAQATNKPCMRTGGSAPIGDASWETGMCTNNNWTDLAHGATTTGLVNNKAGSTGTVDITCNNGTLTYANPVCTTGCLAVTGYTWGSPHNCSVNIPALADGASSGPLSNTVSGRTGSTTATCNTGVLNYSSESCTANSCAAITGHTWGSGCTANVAGVAHGLSSTGTDSLTAGGYTGAVTLPCSYGTWGAATSTSCNANCAVTTQNWGAPSSGQQCTANTVVTASGGTPTLTNTLANHSGSLNMSCSNGSWSSNTPTCTYTPPTCTGPVSVSWGGGNCSRSMATMNNGDTLNNQANTAAGYTGTANITCNAGMMSTTGSPTCYQNCSTTAVNWNTNCTGTAPNMNHGAATQSVSNTASGYTGSVDVDCNNGSYTQTNPTCSITPTSNLYCWGSGYTSTPAILGTVNLTQIVSGANYKCGLTSAGAAYCWGANHNGQLGDGTTTSRAVPTAVTGGHVFTKIYATSSSQGHVTCALKSSGAAYCWGRNYNGSIGDNDSGAPSDRTSPSAVSGGHVFTELTLGAYNTMCGLKSTGAAWCWGFNSVGAVGDGTTTNRYVPTAVAGGHSFTKIYAAAATFCGIRTDNKVYCWGQNTYSETGNGNTTTPQSSPVAASGGLNFASLAAPNALSSMTTWCGVTTAGAGYCWSEGGLGQIGDNGNTDRSVPTLVSGGHVFSKIVTGASFACGLKTSGAVVCWGMGSYGQIGNGANSNKAIPTAVSGGHVFTDIATVDHAGSTSGTVCATKSDGSVYCWGYNGSGILGDGTTTNRNVPTKVLTGKAFSMPAMHKASPSICAIVPENSCDSDNVQWGVSCEANLPGAINGAQYCTSFDDNARTGGSSYTCTNGTWTEVGPSPCLSCCFQGDAVITMEDGSTIPFTELKVGDKVRGETQVNTVLKVPNFDSDAIVYGFNGGKAFVSGGHPIWTTEGWKAIDPELTPQEGHTSVKTTKLEVGDEVKLESGELMEIESIDPNDMGTTHVYSPILDGDNTYYSNGILVHNKPMCDGSEPFGSASPC